MLCLTIIVIVIVILGLLFKGGEVKVQSISRLVFMDTVELQLF